VNKTEYFTAFGSIKDSMQYENTSILYLIWWHSANASHND